MSDSERLIVKTPLGTFLGIIGLVLLPSALLLLLGPAVYIKSWFDAKARILEAESVKESIQILGEEAYFKGEPCQKK